MRMTIINKLFTFLNTHSPIKEEFEVVYLMAELRKILDQDKENNQIDKFPLVRFHADWALHTKKDRITPAIREIMTRISNSIDIYPKDGNVDFLLLPEFKKELIQMLKENNLPYKPFEIKNNWLSFISALSGVLADQPIVNPTEDIAEFCYLDVKEEGIMANIDFCGKRKGESITLGFGF